MNVKNKLENTTFLPLQIYSFPTIFHFFVILINISAMPHDINVTAKKNNHVLPNKIPSFPKWNFLMISFRGVILNV